MTRQTFAAILRSTLAAAVAIAACLAALAAPAHGQLVAYYDFDGNTNDSSGNGLNAINTGMLFTSGVSGSAIANDGSTGRYVTVPLNVGPDVTNKLTWGGWVQLNSLGYQTIAWMEGNYGRSLRIDDRGIGAVSTGTFSYAAFAGRGENNPWPETSSPTTTVTGSSRPLRGVLQGDAAVADSTYRFVATTYDAANKRTVLYVDDKQYEMGNAAPYMPWTWSTFQLGASNGTSENINGAIDDFFVFSSVLSPDQVDTIRTAADPKAAAITVGRQFTSRTWKIDLQDNAGRATTGIDNIAGNGIDEWNVFRVGDYAVTTMNPSMSNLVTTTGSATNVSFHFVDTLPSRIAEYSDLTQQGTTPTWVQPYRWADVAGVPVGRDGVIFNAGGGTTPVADYEIRGLEPGRLYAVGLNGTQASGGSVRFPDSNQPSAFDTDGDGVIDQMMRFNSEAGAFNEFTVKADANGTIRGRTFGTNRSRNTTYGYWIGLSGLQVEEMPEFANLASGSFVAGGKVFTDKPTHAYGFDVHDTAGDGGTIYDRVGGQHGVVREAVNGGGAVLQNGVLDLAGGTYLTGGYGDLPNYILPDQEVTIESWVAMRNVTSGAWRRVFTFGDDKFGGDGLGEYGEMTTAGAGNSPLSAFEYRMQRVRTDGGNRAPAHEVAMMHSVTNPIVQELGLETGTLMNITDDPWQEDVMVHSVITVRDNGKGKSLMTVYHNGSLVYEATMTSNLSIINDVNNWLGRNSDDSTGVEQYANGRYDEFRVWDRALTQSEIQANFSYGADWSGISGDTTGDWRIDATDIDRLNTARGEASTARRYDVNRDGSVNESDVTSLVQTVLETRAGDANLDGKVLINDASIVASNWQQSGRGWATGDFNGDGQVLVNDQSLMQANFGWQRPSPGNLNGISSLAATALASTNGTATTATFDGTPTADGTVDGLSLDGGALSFGGSDPLLSSDGLMVTRASPVGHLNSGTLAPNGSIMLNLGSTSAFNGVLLYEVFIGKSDATASTWQAGTAYLTNLNLLGFDPGLSQPNWVFPFGLTQNRVNGYPDEDFGETASGNFISTRNFDTGVNLAGTLPENGTLWLAYQYQGEQPELFAIAVGIAVPEPSALVLLATGVAAPVVALRRRRRKGSGRGPG